MRGPAGGGFGLGGPGGPGGPGYMQAGGYYGPPAPHHFNMA
jgi:hypothetical protein